MACPHCGDHLVHKRDGSLRCCRCDRLRDDLAPWLPLQGLWRHIPILLMGLLVLPVVCGMGSIDAGRSSRSLGATSDRQAQD